MGPQAPVTTASSTDPPGEIASERWRHARPDPSLTWGRSITGEAFVERAGHHVRTNDASVIVEIGTGYGRILRSWLRSQRPFARYYGIDRSAENCAALEREFAGEPRVRILCGDLTAMELPEPFDLMLSSLTLKHLYPTFVPGLRNLARHSKADATFVFDLLETGWGSLAVDRVRALTGRIAQLDREPRSLAERVREGYGYFEGDGVTYVRRYSRASALARLADCGLSLRSFDHVRHDTGHRRLLVVAAPTGRSGP